MKTEINIVNVPDPNMVEQFLISSAGQETLFNILSNNSQNLKDTVLRDQ